MKTVCKRKNRARNRHSDVGGKSIWIVASVMKSCLILLAWCFSAFSFEISDFDCRKIDSVYNNCPKTNYNRLVSQSPRTYISFSSLDINYDLKTIVTYLLDEKNLTHLFHWFDKFEKIDNTDSTYYYEITYGLFGYWSKIDSKNMVYTDTVCERDFYQNHDKHLNEVMGKRCKRLFVAENSEQIMKWKLTKLGKNKTRVGFTVQSIPTIYVPNWLYKLTINIIIPDCLQDIEDNIKKTNSVSVR